MKRDFEILSKYAHAVISVDSSASLEKVRTLMKAKDISIVPVLDHDQKVNRGVFRSETLCLSDLAANNAKDVMDDKLPSVEHGADFDEIMGKMQRAPGVLLQDETGSFSRYMSPRLVARGLFEQTRKFRRLGEAEAAIRKCLARLSSVPDASSNPYGLDSPKTDLDQLTFGEYHVVVSRNWDRLGLGKMDRTTVLGS